MSSRPLLRVRALRDFEHKGELHREGVAFIVDAGEARRLIEFGLARLESNGRLPEAGPWARPTLR